MYKALNWLALPVGFVLGLLVCDQLRFKDHPEVLRIVIVGLFASAGAGVAWWAKKQSST